MTSKTWDHASLEQKVGQLFMCGFDALTVNEHAEALVREYHIGGIVYFRRNVRDLEQVAALSSSLQSLAGSAGQPPLLISIDQEGGMVARIDQQGMSRIPGNMALGAAGSPEYCYQAAKISGEELRSLGINLNLAPCLDVNNNPFNPVIGVRSFGEDPAAVAELGTAAIRGYQQAGVSAAAKHFPGHGDTSVDSHLGLASVPHGRERLEGIELVPFKEAIREGVDAIMTAHVGFPAIEPDGTPATLSRAVLSGLLREELGFEGLILTDCLEMHAIAKEYGVAEGAVRAVLAGADCILISHTRDEQIAAIEAVVQAVRSGRITEARIEESLKRILELKQRRLSEGAGRGQLETVTTATEKETLLKEIAGKAITLVKNKGQLPLDSTKDLLVIWPETGITTQVDEAWSHMYTLGDSLKKRMPQTEELVVSTSLSDEGLQSAIQKARSFSQVIAVTYTSESRLSEGQRRLVQGLNSQSPEKLIVVSTRNPYDLNEVPEVPAYLCCYENTPVFMDVLADVLIGAAAAEGKLPVTLNISEK
ncbi:beta-N-acetylhexosaminidase [Paenibacillus lemnae]|uniref:Beta-N-acetylhexosaminidase n=1 Tax=Paenibacillus lemnae TaxID=1330551 RepID=A0A848M9H6_PAELE|nr:beta-N-acetylhexosaminidase [Paenibacillus lemnae]NMO96851.1 beta-N-acetylhexosaminidase [Paenibacillus lemnae]